MAELATFTLDDAANACVAEYEAAMASYQARVTERTATRNRYNAMLAEVMKWEPPTPDHAEMKKFMVDQLTESRKFDDYTPSVPLRYKPQVWLDKARLDAARSLVRSRRSLDEEIERCGKANAWIDALYESLNLVAA